MTRTPIPPRETRDDGYLATMTRAGQDPTVAWEIASRLIHETTACNPEAVGDFLGSPLGRRFGFRVLIELARLRPLKVAIEDVILTLEAGRVTSDAMHMGDRATDLPCLTDLVRSFDGGEDTRA